MTVAASSHWVSFTALFLQAEAKGMDCALVADLLLRNVQHPVSAGKVRGIRRAWKLLPEETIIDEMQSSDMRAIEQERELKLAPVPTGIWSDLSGVDDDIMSVWIDDEDEPEAIIEVDWVAGTARMVGHAAEPDPSLEFHEWQWLSHATYSGLEVDSGLASTLLDSAHAEPAKSPAFDDAERRAWMRTRKENVDKAWEAYRKHERCDKMKQTAFREEWREIWKRGRGRPRRETA